MACIIPLWVYAEEVKNLDSENQTLRNKHDKIVEEHAKTLERVDELWKQKWKINWDGVSGGHTNTVHHLSDPNAILYVVWLSTQWSH